MGKRMRLPNGFGSITEIKGKRLRNRFYVRISIGKDANGRPIYKSLSPKAYFATYNDAYAALIDYNRNPYDLNKNITLGGLMELYRPYYYAHNDSISAQKRFEISWKYCSICRDVPVREFRQRHVRTILDEGSIVDRRGNRRRVQ